MSVFFPLTLISALQWGRIQEEGGCIRMERQIIEELKLRLDKAEKK